MFAQSFSHHSGSIHHPQPPAPPPGISPHPSTRRPSRTHSGLSAPTPPNLPPGHSSPQASYTMQGYSLPTHQPLPHGFPSISQLTQAHVTGGMSGPHHSAGHGLPPVMLHYVPPQQGSGSNPQQGRHTLLHRTPPSCSGPGSPTQQLSFHPSAN
ncbi:hypothetical protein D5F01_LYC18094 [Larimichthys crocea]|uniref:Uncharacterized protein n=1 Tax=Larimichthys crocea TaxID=215358 RepID=A0A6G0HU25_LARCR|nr:hypothetical protein D5F01_LYC18094 [Larimichthys crocea]